MEKFEAKRSIKDCWCAAFPGREAIVKGLDSSFYKNHKEMQDLFCEASDFCHKDIAKLCYSTLSIDHDWQTVCLVTHCYAIYKSLIADFGTPDCTAGYSQGEFTACVAAGVLKFPETLGFIYQLEQLLQNSQTDKEGMYRIIDIDVNCLEKICRDVDPTGMFVSISAYISETQNIISGKHDYVTAVISRAREHSARWAIPLNTERAYHCHLRDEPAMKSRPLFRSQNVKAAEFPVYSCYDGKRSFIGERIKSKLSKQLNHPIRWKTLISKMADDGIKNLIEIGPGCTVSANSRIADSRMRCKWIGSMNDL